MKITISKENYLKAVAEAESEGEIVKAATLSRWLSVSAPAVTMALRRLRRDTLIGVADDGRITLTEPGRAIAQRLLVRHHLIERMLAEIFGMEWYKVHDEAEQLEHAVSADFERRLVEKLGTGGECPHGNLGDMERPDERRARGLLPLKEAEPGPYTLACVYERDRAFLEYLESLRLRPGAQITVGERTGQWLALRVEEQPVRMVNAHARRIWVRRQACNG